MVLAALVTGDELRLNGGSAHGGERVVVLTASVKIGGSDLSVDPRRIWLTRVRIKARPDLTLMARGQKKLLMCFRGLSL